MPNTFLGFPVPRATIADMIAANAPSKLHKTQHQLGGTDALDVTGLPGAGGGGGITIPFPAYYYQGIIESLDGYDLNLASGGAISIDSSGATIKTSVVGTGIAILERILWIPDAILDWSNDRQISFTAYFLSLVNNIALLKLTSGDSGANTHIGFKVINGVLYGTVGSGAAETTVSLLALGVFEYGTYYILRAVYTAGVKCEYYVNNVLKGTITTGLPTGPDYSTFIMAASAEANGDVNQKRVTLSAWSALFAG